MYGEQLPPALRFQRQLQYAARHVGTHTDFVHRVRALTGSQRVLVPGQRAELAARARMWCTDDRWLRDAAETLLQSGGQSAGSDGIRLDGLTSEELPMIARKLRDRLRSGTYQPVPARLVSIRKSDGSGMRQLQIPAVQDRIIGKAMHGLLSRFFEPEFDSRSYGFRPGRQRMHALAEATTVTERERRFVWIVDDVVDAFDSVPLERLGDVLRKRLPDGGSFVELLRDAIGRQRQRGLPTGHPLSPLLLNIYLDHFLDRWWRARYPKIPLLRTADDLLVLCRSRSEAERCYTALSNRLQAAGFQLHGRTVNPVHDVRREAIAWLGYNVQHTPRGWSIGLPARWRERFQRTLERLPAPPDGLLTARRWIEGFVAECGPCFAQRDEVVQWLAAQLADRGLQAAADPERLRAVWQAAMMRWEAVRQRLDEDAADDEDET